MATGRLLSHRRGSAGPTTLAAGDQAAIAGGLAAALAIALACGGATLFLRRIAGGFAVTPGPAVALAVVAVGWPLMMATDLAARLRRDAWPVWLARFGLAAAALAVVPVGDGPSPLARLVAASAVGLALVTALAPLPGPWPAAAPRGWWHRRPGPKADGAVPARPAERWAKVPAEPPSPISERPQLPALAGIEPSAVGVRQRLERLETPAGQDCLRGQVLVAVPAGSRTGHAHVGFCPPFAGLPQLAVSTACDLVEAEVVAAEILPWGVRIECRLSEPAEEPLEIPADFVARHPS